MIRAHGSGVITSERREIELSFALGLKFEVIIDAVIAEVGYGRAVGGIDAGLVLILNAVAQQQINDAVRVRIIALLDADHASHFLERAAKALLIFGQNLSAARIEYGIGADGAHYDGDADGIIDVEIVETVGKLPGLDDEVVHIIAEEFSLIALEHERGMKIIFEVRRENRLADREEFIAGLGGGAASDVERIELIRNIFDYDGEFLIGLRIIEMIIEQARGAADDVGIENAVVLDVFGAVGKNERAAGVECLTIHMAHERRGSVEFGVGVRHRQRQRCHDCKYRRRKFFSQVQ